ncbi:phosphoinositide 3-kinase C2 domain protein [Teladorsagia circumcincta]|uniref:Phosphoinositide 3-kinase C2 domain protein n=1 Tax=Teladorsagia circumcincta TaxID=45464 RepID=A0A2G9TQ05_TELCI|nr:phosphoinositide 3-kinase C2 domain protein [Teladorsagia circumcincta]
MGTSDMDSQISVDFTVYCGKTSLTRKTSAKVPSHNPRWLEGMISFDLYMKDLPPAAILTVHLVETKMKKGKPEDRVLGWANIRLLDWKGELLQGVVTLNLWGGEPQYPPHGRIGSNDKKQVKNSIEWKQGEYEMLGLRREECKPHWLQLPFTSRLAHFPSPTCAWEDEDAEALIEGHWSQEVPKYSGCSIKRRTNKLTD